MTLPELLEQRPELADIGTAAQAAAPMGAACQSASNPSSLALISFNARKLCHWLPRSSKRRPASCGSKRP